MSAYNIIFFPAGTRRRQQSQTNGKKKNSNGKVDNMRGVCFVREEDGRKVKLGRMRVEYISYIQILQVKEGIFRMSHRME